MQFNQGANWYLHHPEKLNKYENSIEEKRAAFRVYLDLCENKDWTEVELKYSAGLKRIYLIGKPEIDTENFILPVEGDCDLSQKEFEELFTALHEEKTPQSITLAFVGSSIVYYHLTKGIFSPHNPDIM